MPYRVTHNALKVCAAALLLGISGSAWAHDSPPPPRYSLSAQIDGVTAFQATLASLDRLDRDLLLAYGRQGSILRAEAVRLTPLSRPVRIGPIESPASLGRKEGHQALQRIASLEPLISLCAVNSDALALRLLTRETSLLLKVRHLATQGEIAAWIEEGGTDGSERLAGVAQLDCPAVRRAFRRSSPALRRAYQLTRSARIEPPLPR